MPVAQITGAPPDMGEQTYAIGTYGTWAGGVK